VFYYLGRKKRVASKYPEPALPIIVEPFAGSAAYSLHGNRWKLRVIVNDLNPDVIGVWRYLQSATERDIKTLPDFKPGDKLSDIASLSEDERWLIAFHINPGANQRSNTVTKFNRWGAGKLYIEKNLHKIKHWEIRCGEYHQLDDIGPATWFVDPPYQATGKYYMVNTVEFDALRGWALARPGQLIVCERSGASWLPFAPLGGLQAICGKKQTQEVVYVRDDPSVESCPGCGVAMRATGPAEWRCACGSRVRYLSFEEAEMDPYYPECVISGAQTGADRGALIAAMRLGYETGGWVPKGRLSEDGVVPPEFNVTEIDGGGYPERTKLNVECADATVIFTYEEELTGGSALTVKLMREAKKPGYHMPLERDASACLNKKAGTEFRRWLARVRPRTLNIAGSRESKAPGIQEHVAAIVGLALQRPSQCVCGRQIPEAIWAPDAPARTQDTPVKCSVCGHQTRWSDFDATKDPAAAPF